ncbi:hypothetical protein H9L15_08630 [Sphingomonas daechungensis]|uniref:Uncharacterized protein n=1 Tax=Sphingomonas daechungensis TaxID=1176646 RepID=A0ABX6SYK3_9SPHN|nr:hypothetical protein [Sphingomonas daechungensis]QNP42384.1 hypothetical protein H9L15_08630 [Sphingomonas daechungensis]
MPEYIADYRRRAAYFRELATNTADHQVVADLLFLADDCEHEANKLEDAFGLVGDCQFGSTGKL